MKDASGSVMTAMTPDEVKAMIADGTIAGGMIPKTETALKAIEEGVRAVVILDGRVPNACLLELFTEHGAGPDPPDPVTLSELDGAARKTGLAIRGAFHPEPGDAAPDGTGTLVLLGPDEPSFWPVFTAAPEYQGMGWPTRWIAGPSA